MQVLMDRWGQDTGSWGGSGGSQGWGRCHHWPEGSGAGGVPSLALADTVTLLIQQRSKPQPPLPSGQTSWAHLGVRGTKMSAFFDATFNCEILMRPPFSHGNTFAQTVTLPAIIAHTTSQVFNLQEVAPFHQTLTCLVYLDLLHPFHTPLWG